MTSTIACPRAEAHGEGFMANNKIIFDSVADKKVRKQLCFNSHYFFFHLQLSHYVKYETAIFHKEMFAITED